MGRFLNADALTSTGQGVLGNNMYVYCLNTPTIFVDYAGQRAVISDFLAGATEEYITMAKIRSDIRNFNLLNANPDLVYNAYFFSAYNGTLVIRHTSSFLTSWAIGETIFLNHSNDSLSSRVDTLKHEFGHVLQEKSFGTLQYLFSVFIPSVTYNLLSRGSVSMNANYYNMPWEYDADKRGNADRNHAWWAAGVSELYFSLWR